MKQEFYEFFAGGGMARLGLGADWTCTFANEWCGKKASAYRANFGPCPELTVRDIRKLDADKLPGCPTLAWASFPCQDLSLAGKGKGLNGERSSMFWPFWNLMLEKKARGQEAPIIVIENVVGLLTSNDGQDITAVLDAIAAGGYRYGLLVAEAHFFVPQSRPRLFIISVAKDLEVPAELIQETPTEPWHPRCLTRAYYALPERIRESSLWFALPVPSARVPSLAELIEENPGGVSWHTQAETKRLLDLMSPTNLEKVRAARQIGKRVVGTVYRRTRINEHGEKTQRAEVRFDHVSGCLRTPAGGSSRQVLLIVEGREIRSRLLSPREAARLMGLLDTYALPKNYNEGYHLMGDGLVVPVVSWINRHILTPLAAPISARRKAAGKKKVA